MIKKIFTYFLVFCFFSSMICSQALSLEQQCKSLVYERPLVDIDEGIQQLYSILENLNSGVGINENEIVIMGELLNIIKIYQIDDCYYESLVCALMELMYIYGLESLISSLLYLSLVDPLGFAFFFVWFSTVNLYRKQACCPYYFHCGSNLAICDVLGEFAILFPYCVGMRTIEQLCDILDQFEITLPFCEEALCEDYITTFCNNCSYTYCHSLSFVLQGCEDCFEDNRFTLPSCEYCCSNYGITMPSCEPCN